MANSTKIGSLVVDVDGDINKLRAEMRSAVGVVTNMTQEVQARTAALKNSFDTVLNPIRGMTSMLGPLAAGFGAILSINAFGKLVSDTAEASGKLYDLSMQTGISVEQLSALESVGKLSDVSLDSIANSANKMSKNLASATEDGKGAAGALRALNIDFNSFRKLSPDEQMLTVAKAMDNFADGGGKSAAAMALLGKEGAAMIPFLKDLAAAGDLNAKVTTEQSAMADNYGDNLVKIRAASEAWKRQLALSMLPVMEEVTGAWLEATNSNDGLGGSIKRLAADGTFTTWARNAVTAVTYLIDVGHGLLSLLPLIGTGIAGMAAAGSAAFGAIYDAYLKIKEGDLSGAWDSLKSGATQVGTIAKETGKDISEIWNQELLGEKIRKGMDQVRSARKEMAAEDRKPQVDSSKFNAASDSETKSAKEKASAYDSLVKSINEKIAVQTQELEAGQALTDAEKLASKVMVEVRDGVLKLTEAEKVHIGSLLEQLLAEEKSNSTRKEMLKLGADLVKSGNDQLKSLDAQIEAAARQNEEIGLTKEQVDQLAISRIEMAAAADEELAANVRVGANYAGDLKDAYLEYATSLEEAAKKKRELANIKQDSAERQADFEREKKEQAERISFWESIDKTAHDTFVSMADGGKQAAQRIKETFKNVFFDWLYQMTVKKWIVNLSAGVTMTASGSAMASTGGMESMLNPSNLMSAGQSLWQGFTAAGTLGNGFWGSLAGGLQGAGAGSGLTSSLGLDIGNYLQSALGNNVAGSLSSGISSISAAMPYAAAAIAAFQISKGINGGYRLGGLSADAGALLGIAPRLFGMKEKELGGQTVTGTLGTDNLMRNQSWTQDGGLFRSDRSGVWSYGLKDSTAIQDSKSYVDAKSLDSDKALLKILNGGYDAVKAASTEFAKILGLNAEEIAKRNDALNLTLGKTQEETDKVIAAVFGGIADAIALDLSPQIAALRKEGESSAGALARLATGLGDVNAQVSAMGFAKFDASIEGASAAQRLVDATGGQQNFSAGASFFSQNFLSEADRMKPLIESVAKSLESLGLSSLKTVEDFKLAVVGGVDASGNLVKGLDLTTEAGAQTFAQMMAIAPQFKTVADYTDQLSGALSQTSAAAQAAADALKLANEVEQERIGLQAQINALTMSAAEAMLAQRNAVNEANREKWDELQMLQKKRSDEEAAAQLASQIAAERAGLQNELNQLTMTELELAALKRNSYYKENLDLYDQLQEAQLQAKAVASVQRDALDESEKAANKMLSAWQSVSDSIFAEVNRIRQSAAEGTPRSFAGAQSRLVIAQSQARAGDLDAAKSLPELSKLVISMAEREASSQDDLDRIKAKVAASLESTAMSMGKQGIQLPAAKANALVPEFMYTPTVPSQAPSLPAAQSPDYTLTNAIVKEIKELKVAIENLQSPTDKIASNTDKLKDNIQRVTLDGEGMRLEAV